MVKITKSEKDYLLSKGCRWHKEIMASYTRRHYYAIESQKVIDLLNQYRDSVIISHS